MTGIIVQLLLSWLLLWIIERKNLSVLGFYPSANRLWHFFLFMILTAACCASGFLMKIYFGNQSWILNPDLSACLLLKGAWWNIKSVLFEELAFRGALLYILYKRIGAFRAIAISAIAFGIYHWFSFGVIGNPVSMAVVFMITGLMGLVLAFGYVRSLSLYIPIGIHFGWNFTQIFVFSQGPIGNGIFIPTNKTEFRTDSMIVFILVTFLPLVSALVVNFFLIKKLAKSQQVLEISSR